MRHHHRSQHASARRTTSPLLSGLLFGVSVLALSLSHPATAQEQPIVDISDPNVSVDLSVLNDGGLAPQMGAPLPAATAASTTGAGGYRPPGAKMPVSTLYIQPSGGFSLPPQTKPIEAKPAPTAKPTQVVSAPAEPAPDEAMQEDATPVGAEAPAEETPTIAAPAEAVKVEAEPAPAPTPAPVEHAKAEPAPVEAPMETPAPAEAAKVEPAPAPVETVKAEPAPAPQPTPQPVETVKAEPTPQPEAAPAAETPPPPPQALVKPETKPAPAAQPAQPKQDTRPSTVVDLPPKDVAPGVASLPDASGPLGDGDNMRIVFERESSKLPPDARDALGALAKQLIAQEGLRLQLLAYAGDADTSASAARRLSLSRALAVRSFLIESGVRSTRIDVRALGNKSSEDVTERVDITVMER